MARYTGPKHKLCRRIGKCLWNDPKCPSKKKPYAPGSAGKSGGKNTRRGKRSNYGLHLEEKQKLKMTYGMLEKQFKNTYMRAQKMRGVTGDNFMQLLERRLDSLVYRLGFAPTIFAARQLVNHGHVRVDDKKVDIPSFCVNVGQKVSFREKSLAMPLLQKSKERRDRDVPDYLECDTENLVGRLTLNPRTSDIPVTVDTNLIVEFYSR